MDFTCQSCFGTRGIPLSSTVGRHDEGTFRFISAATTEGIGRDQANRLLVKLDIGGLNNKVHARVVGKVDKAAAAVFGELSSAALEREVALTLLMEGDACKDKSGKVMITVIGDGTWQKRYGRSSLAGFVGVYGLYKGGCLYKGSKMARCATCQHYKSKGVAAKDVKKHDCTRTWNEAPNKDGATSNMEKVITLEAIQSIYEKGVMVQTQSREHVDL